MRNQFSSLQAICHLTQVGTYKTQVVVIIYEVEMQSAVTHPLVHIILSVLRRS